MPEGPTSVDPTADRMLDAARQGSNRAWAALLERLDPACRDLAHLVLGGHGVDEVLLVAYVRAYRARRKGPSDAFVFLAHHVWVACGHEIRRLQRRAHPAPGRRAERDDRPPRLGPGPVATALAALRPEERAVWALSCRDQLPVEVVADALGVDPQVITGVAARVEARIGAASTGDVEVAGEADTEVPDEGEPTGELDVGAHEDERPDADRAAGQLEPDPPGAEFWPELGRRLRAERHSAPAAPGPGRPQGPDPEVEPPPDAETAIGESQDRQRHGDNRPRRRRSRSRKTEVVSGLAADADRRGPRRHWPSVLVRVAAVVAAAAIVGAAVFTLYRAASNARSPVRGETVADRARQSMEVLAEADTWSATVEQIVADEKGQPQRARVEVAADGDGSYRVEDSAIGRITTYNARFAALRDTLTNFPPRDEVGVAPGPPDPSAPRAGFPMEDLAAAARALSVEDDVAPVEAQVNGRRLWRLDGTLEGGLAVSYYIEMSSLVPVRVTWRKDDRVVRELRFRDVQLGTDVGPFTQDLPKDSPPPVDREFVPVPLGDVRSRIDMKPLTPDVLPPGFELVGTAWVDEEMRIVSTRYARGPQQIVITLRPSPVEAGKGWDDPFDRAGEEVESKDLPLESGPFRGGTAQIVSGGRALPSVWYADGEQAFTVAGDLSTEDLVAVTQSLR